MGRQFGSSLLWTFFKWKNSTQTRHMKKFNIERGLQNRLKITFSQIFSSKPRDQWESCCDFFSDIQHYYL
jgi:hypothetical protein